MAVPLFAFAKKEAVSDTISARSALIDMPDRVLDLLPAGTRLDMLDYLAVDSVYRAPNALSGDSYIRELTPDYASVQLTGASTYVIKILKLKNGNDIIMTVRTAGTEGDSQDSELAFYDTRFSPLPAENFIKAPALADFFSFPKGSQTNMKEIEAMLPFYTVSYEVSPGTDTLVARLTPGDFLTIEDRKLVELFLRPALTYRWNGSTFKKS